MSNNKDPIRWDIVIAQLHCKNNGMKFIPKEYDLYPNEFHTCGMN